jgi:hypothetical protein
MTFIDRAWADNKPTISAKEGFRQEDVKKNS